MTEEIVFTTDIDEEIAEEDIEELQELAGEYSEICREFSDEIDRIMEDINETDFYRKLDKELHISIEYLYSLEEREQ